MLIEERQERDCLPLLAASLALPALTEKRTLFVLSCLAPRTRFESMHDRLTSLSPESWYLCVPVARDVAQSQGECILLVARVVSAALVSEDCALFVV